MVRFSITAAIFAASALAQVQPDPAGQKNIGNGRGVQFINGACLSSRDCQSQCCAFNGPNFGGICSGPGAQFQQGKLGCGFGDGGRPPVQPGQPFPGQPGQPGQPFPGQPGQPFPGQPCQPGFPCQGQPFPGQPFPGQPQPGFPCQPRPGFPCPGQPGFPQQPGQPFPGQPFPGQPCQPGFPCQGQPFPGQPFPGNCQPGFPCQPFPGNCQPGFPCQPGQFPYPCRKRDRGCKKRRKVPGSLLPGLPYKLLAAGEVDQEGPGAVNVGSNNGQQGDLGQCFSDADCQSGCCSKPDGACVARNAAEDDGGPGCGFTVPTALSVDQRVQESNFEAQLAEAAEAAELAQQQPVAGAPPPEVVPPPPEAPPAARRRSLKKRIVIKDLS